MSSASDGEPRSEDPRLSDARRGRGRGRRGRLWRRHDDELPVVGGFEPDEVEALLRLGSTTEASDRRPEDAVAEDPAEPRSSDRTDSISSRVGGRSGHAPTRPADADDVNWGALVTPGEDDRPPVPEPADLGPETSDAADEWARLIDRSAGRSAEAPDEPAAEEARRQTTAADQARGGSDEDRAEAPTDAPALVPDEDPAADEIEAATEQATPEREPDGPERHRSEESAEERVIADAVEGGFAAPFPALQPKGLGRLRRRATGAGSLPKLHPRSGPEFVDAPMLEEPIPDLDRPTEVPKRPADVLAHSRTEDEPLPDAEVVAALAARTRRDAELAAAEQAAERIAAEEAAQRASEARAAAEERAREMAEAAAVSAAEHAELARRLQAELVEIQQQALEQARARVAAEAAAAAQAHARAEAEARAAELVEQVAEIRARTLLDDEEAASAGPDPAAATAGSTPFAVIPAADELTVDEPEGADAGPLPSVTSEAPQSLVERWRAGATTPSTAEETDEVDEVVSEVDEVDDAGDARSLADAEPAPAEAPSLLDQWRGTATSDEPATDPEAVDDHSDAPSGVPIDQPAAADVHPLHDEPDRIAAPEPEDILDPEPVAGPEPAVGPELVEPEPETVGPASVEPEPDPVEPEPETVEPLAAPVTARAADVAPTNGSPAAVKRIPFHARRGNGSLPWIATLVALACAFVVGRMAYRGTLWDDVPLSATLTVVTTILLGFALKAGNSARSVHLDESGILKVTVGDMNSRFDLTSPNTRIEQTGAPGQRNWRVSILRRSMSPVTIDSRMVDPHTFMEALRQWRPDL